MRTILKPTTGVFTLSLLLTATSCPGTDVIKVDTGDFVLVFEVTNQTSRFNDNAGDFAGFNITEFNIRPFDPANARCSDSLSVCASDSDCPAGETCFFGDADAALGSAPLSVVTGAPLIDLNLQSTTLNDLGGVRVPPLNSGQYRVVKMRLERVTLIDDNPPLGATDCHDLVVDPGPDRLLDTADDFSRIPDPRARLVVSEFELTDLGMPVFTLSPDGGVLTVTVDAAELIDAFEAGFTCRTAFMDTCLAVPPYMSHACLTAFDDTVFPPLATTFLSFN